MRTRRFLTLIASLMMYPGFQAAQDTYDVRAHYAKSEVMIPMRDGVKRTVGHLMVRLGGLAGRQPAVKERLRHNLRHKWKHLPKRAP